MTTTCDAVPLPGAVAGLLSARTWASDAPGEVHTAAARKALGEGAAPSAVALLASELHKMCIGPAGLVAVLANVDNPTPGDLAKVPERDGMTTLDAAFADWWATHLDADGAAKLRSGAQARLADCRRGDLDGVGLYEKWADGGAARLASVARALWRCRVAAKLQRRRDVPAALVRAVAVDRLIPAMTGQAVLSTVGDGKVRDKEGRELGRIATVDAAMLHAVQRGLEQLGTVTGHRLLRYLVLRVHDQWQTQAADWRAVDFAGGLSALADAVHYSRRDFEQLQQLLSAGQHVQWTHPAVKIGGLWVSTYRRGAPGLPGLVRIVVNDPLAPTVAARLAQGVAADTSHDGRTARRLVPELRAEPPVSAVNERSQGAAWTMHRLWVGELVDRAEELHNNGSVALDTQRWATLARAANMPAERMALLLDSWRSGDDVAPPLLTEPEPGRFTLADSHRLELDFIADGGQRRSEGRERAKLGKARKARSRK